MSEFFTTETPEQQLARLQGVIAKIETGCQEIEFQGRRWRKADLAVLYKRERELLDRIAGRGGIRVSRIVPR